MFERFETFTVLISKISRNIRKIKSVEMAEFDLKTPHTSCLYYLYRDGAMTASELSARCGEDKASISRSIEYLEERGYLKCDSKQGRRYKALITLTDRGQEIANELSEKIHRILGFSGASVTEEEREAFYRHLREISDNLEKLANSYDK